MSSYAELLRRALEETGISRRKLSFLLAAETGNQQPSEYRSLGKYLNSDETPGPERAQLVADLLQRPEVATINRSRTDRLRELEERVEAREQQGDAFAQEVLARLAALEATQGLGAQQPSRQETERRG